MANCNTPNCTTPIVDTPISMCQAVTNLIQSIAAEEMALSRILNAESEKMKKAICLDGVDLCKLLEINDSATNMVHAVANLELVLKDKLEFVANNLYYPCSGCGCEDNCGCDHDDDDDHCHDHDHDHDHDCDHDHDHDHDCGCGCNGDRSRDGCDGKNYRTR